MHLQPISFNDTAARGALVGGAARVDAGNTPGRVVVDSNRPSLHAVKSAVIAGIAQRPHFQAAAPI